jgi:hypothetical protein
MYTRAVVGTAMGSWLLGRCMREPHLPAKANDKVIWHWQVITNQETRKRNQEKPRLEPLSPSLGHLVFLCFEGSNVRQ